MKALPSGEEPLASAKMPGEPQTVELPMICNAQDHFDVPALLSRFSPDDLISAAFLHDAEGGQKVRAKVTKKILDRGTENHGRS